MSGQQETVEDAFEEVEEVSFTPSYQIKLWEFIDRQNIDRETLSCYLYKFDDPNGRSLSKSFIEKYTDREPPDEDEIGKSFGSGRYILCVSIPAEEGKKGSSKMRGYRFRIHPRYDKIQKEQSVQAPSTPQASSLPVQYMPMQQQNGMKEAFSMIKDIMALFIPLMATQKQSGLDEIMSESYSAMNNVMKTNMIENFRMFKQFTKSALLDQPGGDEDMFEDAVETEKEPTLLEQFAPLLNEWLPKILGGGVQGRVLNQVVQNTPQFQQLINDKVELRKVIKYLVDTRGPAETAQILDALNIPHSIGRGAQMQPGSPAVSKKQAGQSGRVRRTVKSVKASK